MPNETGTYVKSLNGYTGNGPFMDGSVKIDASDIHKTGTTGDTITSAAQQIAQNIRMLTMERMSTEGDFVLKIGNYPLSVVN